MGDVSDAMWDEMIDQMIQEDKEVIIKNMREDMQQIRK